MAAHSTAHMVNTVRCGSTLLQLRAENEDVPMWVPDSGAATGAYLVPAKGLFPRPLGASAPAALLQRICARFHFLGRLLGKALVDRRIVPMPLRPVSPSPPMPILPSFPVNLIERASRCAGALAHGC